MCKPRDCEKCKRIVIQARRDLKDVVKIIDRQEVPQWVKDVVVQNICLIRINLAKVVVLNEKIE